MKLIQHEYYTFQHRKVMESPWLKSKPLRAVKPIKEWCGSWFGKYIDPLSDEGAYRYPNTRQCYEVWSITGAYGFWSLADAKEALKRLRKANAKGEFDYTDSYGHKEQSVRYEFRIVKITHTKDLVEPVEE